MQSSSMIRRANCPTSAFRIPSLGGRCHFACCVILLHVTAPWGVAQSLSAEIARSDIAIHVAAILTHEDALNEAHDVELEGDRAFVAGKGGSVAIVDIADPNRPALVWFRRDPSGLRDSETVLLSPGRLFLGTKDFLSIDISDPLAPKFDAVLNDRSKIRTINGLVRRGEYIFAASKEGLVTAIDVSDPATPEIAGVMDTRELHGFHSPHDIDLTGPYVVVVDPNRFGERPGQLAIFRVFDDGGCLLPDSAWELAGRIAGETLNGANRVQVQGRYAYVAGSYSPKISQGRTLAKGIVVDLQQPTDPRHVALVEFPDVRGPNGLTVAGNVWFLAGGQTVQAYDIGDPVHPRLLASFTSAEAFPTADDNAHDLVYRDGYLYVTSQGDNALVILRVD